MTLAVECADLKKVFKLGFFARRVRALDGITFSVNEGEVFGLIGPNGAGKSTTIKILLNLVLANSGHAKFFGRDVREPAAREGVGYVPESPVPYEYLTGVEYLQLQARLCGLKGADLQKQVTGVIERVGMATHGKLPIRRYSKGMTQRIMLAGAMLGRPRLVILDEPTSGLDPLGRMLVRDIILEQRKAGVSVLFCTHIISDVESLCDRVALLVGGTIQKQGAINELVGGSRIHEVVLENATSEALASLEGVQKVEQVAGRAIIQVGDDRLQALLAQALSRNCRITKVHPVRFSLEDTFLEVMKNTSQTVGGALQ